CVMVGAYHTTRVRRDAAAQAEDVARQVGLGAQLHMRADALTLAGRKRLELARALATRPKLLPLDEVMSRLIPKDVEESVGMVRRIHATGVVILLIEHVMQAVISLAARVYVLSNGRIIANGSPRRHRSLFGPWRPVCRVRRHPGATRRQSRRRT